MNWSMNLLVLGRRGVKRRKFVSYHRFFIHYDKVLLPKNEKKNRKKSFSRPDFDCGFTFGLFRRSVWRSREERTSSVYEPIRSALIDERLAAVAINSWFDWGKGTWNDVRHGMDGHARLLFYGFHFCKLFYTVCCACIKGKTLPERTICLPP